MTGLSHWVSQTEATDRENAHRLKARKVIWFGSEGFRGNGNRVETAWRGGGGKYSRMVKSITWEAKQKTGCSYISLFFPIKEDLGMQEA